MKCAFCHQPSPTQCCKRCDTLYWEVIKRLQREAEENYKQDQELGA